MPRLRRKTPHEPVRAVPATGERGAGARPPLDAARERLWTPRSLAIELNRGRPRADTFDDRIPEPEVLVTQAPIAPFRDRVVHREGRSELLVFRVGPELFATELRVVEEAVEGVTARPVPDAVPAMLGIFALRDRTLPVYALAQVLGIAADGRGEMTLVIRPTDVRIAIAVDAVDDVYDVALGAVRATPAASDADGVVLGVIWRGSELITLLDADAVVGACLAAAAPPDSL